MGDAEKVVVRFLNGTMLKGLIRNFSVEATEIHIEEAETGVEHRIPLAELKAVFFVKSLEGNRAHREKKVFGARKDADYLGRKVYIKFKDGENMYGFYRGDIPWKQGYFVAEPHSTAQGFFITPTDSESNNIRIFVVGSSLKDITAIVP
jgi:small nuclear ribonucleoprotein (snRNP)-like protein